MVSYLSSIYKYALEDHALAVIFCVGLSEVKAVLYLEMYKMRVGVNLGCGKFGRHNICMLQTSSAVVHSHQECVCAFVWADEWVEAK